MSSRHRKPLDPSPGASCVVPEGVAVERPERIPPGWDAPDDFRVAREVGLEWLGAGRAAVLDVPSVTARPHERTLVLNPAHPDSLDGRYFGPLPASAVIGRAVPLHLGAPSATPSPVNPKETDHAHEHL